MVSIFKKKRYLRVIKYKNIYIVQYLDILVCMYNVYACSTSKRNLKLYL